jgi:hypothetical protein
MPGRDLSILIQGHQATGEMRRHTGVRLGTLGEHAILFTGERLIALHVAAIGDKIRGG